MAAKSGIMYLLLVKILSYCGSFTLKLKEYYYKCSNNNILYLTEARVLPIL